MFDKKKWNSENREKINKTQQAWNKANPEKVKEHAKNYRDKHREKNKLTSKNWVQNNRERHNRCLRKYTHKLHDKVIDLLGGKCISHIKYFGCECIDKRILQVNHIDGGGCKEFKKVGSIRFYKAILDGKRKTDDLDVRCANCNILFKWENKERT